MKKWIAISMVVPLLLIAAYLAIVLNVSYSDGERAGYLQKFSRKGWLCKTYEGEIALSALPGVAPVLWQFTVKDEALAALINAQMGKRVSLVYTEHKGIPTSCFGETSYFVQAVKPLLP